jgi:aminoglycoside phosphotransferase
MELPESFRNLVTGYAWNQVMIGESSSKTYRLRRQHYPMMYLKITPKQPGRELLAEKNVLSWLSGMLPVTKILAFAEDDNNDYLLTSEIPGSDAASLSDSIDKSELVKLLAQGLRLIHEVPVSNCPFNRSLDKAIEIAGFNMKHNLVHESDFDGIRRGKTAAEIYQELFLLKPRDEDLVFTHGDYCLPNIIIKNKEISGFIDLSRAGIADRYQDIALAIRSIRSNLGLNLEQQFFNEYGIVTPDHRKIEYYQLLDEFF